MSSSFMYTMTGHITAISSLTVSVANFGCKYIARVKYTFNKNTYDPTSVVDAKDLTTGIFSPDVTDYTCVSKLDDISTSVAATTFNYYALVSL